MNVFACSACPDESARSLADRHVIKMVLETAQILSTTASLLGLESDDLYRPTHKHHPVITCCAYDPKYRSWVFHHGISLGKEYSRRFDRIHKSVAVIKKAGDILGCNVPGNPRSFPMAMPDEFRREDPHESYRLYLKAKYESWGDKAKWTRANRPDWLV